MGRGLSDLPVGRFDIIERFDAWEERGIQHWISRDGTKKGGECLVLTKIDEDVKG